MMRSRTVQAPLLLLGLLLASAPLPAAAGATPHAVGPYKVKALRVISGPSPFAAGCPGARFDDRAIAGYELEPMVTVNPANPRNLVATWSPPGSRTSASPWRRAATSSPPRWTAARPGRAARFPG